MIRTFCALLCLLALAVAARAETLMLAPNYDVVGTSPDGSKYSGTVTIDKISDTTFAIRWEIGSSVLGFGMHTNDSIAATFMAGDNPGLIIYKVDNSGELSGVWSVRGHDGSGTERLTPQK
jgi:hypothetical protein